jgi:opacity protein-like surface antigen
MKKLLAMLAVAVPGTAVAQNADWTYKATLYAWLPYLTAEVETLNFGTVEVGPAGGSDILDSLEFAFMGTFAATYDKWTFAGDLMYASLSSTKPAPVGALYESATISPEVSALSGYALYRVYGNQGLNADLGVGFRNFNLGMDVAVAGVALPDESFSLDDTWTDPLIAAKVSIPLGDRFSLQGFADYGGTADTGTTWQAYAGVEYAFSEAWSTQFGYRIMNIDRDVKGRDVSLDIEGALLAVSYQF